MYGHNMPPGYQVPPVQPKIPKLTKNVAETYIMHTLRRDNLDFVSLTEKPRVWKHSCIASGATPLHPQRILYYGIPIDYIFCTACGKVQYYYDKEALI